jgi:prevent-host-death family protein
MQVSVRELKDHLSKYLHSVQMGESIVVTSHHVPMVRIVPVSQSKNKDIQALLQTEGVHWNGKKPTGNKNPPKISGKQASDYIQEDRR